MKRDIELRGASRRDFIKAVFSASAVLGLGPTRALEVMEKMGGSALAADAIDANYSVNLIAGFGSLSWFTTLWPCPPMINAFKKPFAYDSKANVVKVFDGEGRQLWARGLPANRSQGLWQNFGDKKLVTAMLCGTNNMHEDVPVLPGNSNTIVNGVSTGGVLSAFGGQAVLQQNIKAIVPVIGMNSRLASKLSMPYQRFGTKGPQMAIVPNKNGIIGLFNSQASQLATRLMSPDRCSVFRLYYNAFLDLAKTRDQATYQRAYSDSNVAVDLLCVNYGPLLLPTTGQAQMWTGNPMEIMNSKVPGVFRLTDMAETLIITANAFKLGLCSQIIIPVLEDDPHFAFGQGYWAREADSVTLIMQSFLDELSRNNVPGTTVPLSDYVVITVSGDLPKNSYKGSGAAGAGGTAGDWEDATYARANWIYVMSNGYLKPGWFGEYLNTPVQGKRNYDPATGALDTDAAGAPLIKQSITSPGTPDGTCTDAALAATLYAVARGNKAKVGPLYDMSYDGLIKTA